MEIMASGHDEEDQWTAYESKSDIEQELQRTLT